MAKRSISVKEVDELELQFENGKSLVLRFDTEALMFFDDLEGGLSGLTKTKSMTEMCAMIMYVGAKKNQPDFTIEESKKITSNLSVETINEIMEEFNQNMGISKNEVQSELQKKLMTQFLQNWMK